MTEDSIMDFITQRVKDAGYKSVNFQLALVKEESWKILVARIIFDIEYPWKRETLLKQSDFVIEHFPLPLEEFQRFFEYLKRLNLAGNRSVKETIEHDPNEFFEIGGYMLHFNGNFPTKKVNFLGRQRAKNLRGIDRPIHYFDYYLGNSVVPRSYLNVDVSGHEIPFTNVFNALNYYWKTNWQQFHLSSVNCGIYLPLFDASIKNVEFNWTDFKIEIDLPLNFNNNALSVGINAGGFGEQQFAKKFPVAKNITKITMPFPPAFATLFLHKGKEKLDEYYWDDTGAATKKNSMTAIEIPDDDFEASMKIFISHKFIQQDQELALKLREILKSKKIKGFLAESKREYELLIGEKIRNEIDDSDYVIGIITQESEKSASVNQELGYALGKDIPVVIMLEKEVQHGVLTHGREVEEFTREKFNESCNKVLEYIIKKGPRKKDERAFTQQELLVQKNAHFRYELESGISQLIYDFTYRLDINPDDHRLTSSEIHERIRYLEALQTFMTHELDKIKKVIMEKHFLELRKLGRDYHNFARSIESSQRFPHDDLLPDEGDLFIKLNQKMLNYSDHEFDPWRYIKNYIEDYGLKKYNTYGEILQNLTGIDKEDLERQLGFYMDDLSKFMATIIQLQKELEYIRQKYGDLAFKSAY